jgi:hypothetical protein
VLTLARAFQLMSQALSEFRSPVGQEALRLRMVAMHGREDPLLDATRFPRLLRQANDAEVADVRKVGDDDYEIALQRQPSRPMPPLQSREETQEGVPGAEPTPEPAPAASRENGQRLGLRFRRGSRGPARAGEIPLIGVVRMEPPVVLDDPEAADSMALVEIPEAPPTEKPARASRPRRKRAAAAPAGSKPAGESAGPAASPPKRPRARPRKKAE